MNRWLFVPSGCGGFLDPPGWPTHTTSVQEKQGKTGRTVLSIISLSGAALEDWVPAHIRIEAQRRLDEARDHLLGISDPIIIDWCAEVENYFKDCYSPDGINRNAGNCIIKKRSPRARSLAVLHIREWFPAYRITPEIKRAMPNVAWSRK